MKQLIALTALFGFAAALFVAGGSPAWAEPEYRGVKGCATCHKKEKDGEQLKIWEKSEHAEAYELLGKPKAKEAAAKVGVSGNPQKAEACLVCHTTGYGADKSRFDKKFKIEDGVQCEACHGPGGDYRKKKVMQAIYKERGKDRKGDSPTAKKVGLTFPDENTCKTCHAPEIKFNGKTYKNPAYKDFDFKKSWDKIKHPIPERG